MDFLAYFIQLTELLPFGEYLQNKYVLSILILVLFIVLAKLLLFIIVHYFEKFTARTKTTLDDLIIERTKMPLFYSIVVYGFRLAILNLEINGTATKIVNSLMALVFILLIARGVDIAIEIWGKAFAKKTKTNIDDAILPLFHKASKIIFLIIAFIWVLDIYEVNITPYLAGVGISGLVLGLALQDSLKNIFGGITLILDRTYRIGDKIKLESGEIGIIHDVGLRSTKLITYDNEIIYIPNGYLANSRVLNYTRPTPKARVSVNFGVEYGTEVERVKKVVLDATKTMGDILDDPAPIVQFQEMGDFALQFTLRFWVAKWDQANDKKVEATEKVYAALNKAKINIPFPTRTIYLKKMGK
ncbi:MAG: mechanosensitive ion channel domain-containing protein [Nanoarchaeota archaeon]